MTRSRPEIERRLIELDHCMADDLEDQGTSCAEHWTLLLEVGAVSGFRKMSHDKLFRPYLDSFLNPIPGEAS